MAHMIPDEPPIAGPGSHAEALVFEALRRSLDDDWFVYGRLRYVEDGRAREGECDFVLLHRERGLLVVEVKGKGVRRTGSGRWMRVDENGRDEEMPEGPFEQAQRQVKELVRKLERRAGEVWPGTKQLPFVHGHAVAFPLADADTTRLPLEAPRDIVFDAGDLADAGAWVERALAFWARNRSGRPSPIDPKEFKRFRRAVLHPAVDFVPRLGARIEADERRLVQLTQEQVDVVAGFVENPRLRVKGGAGTGKTVLALEAARHFAAAGGDVLLVCFNRYLGNELAADIANGPPLQGRVEALHFHRLCARAYDALGRELAVPEDRHKAADFWSDEAPIALIEAYGEEKLSRWDAIVIDEGQDFAAAWWDALDAGLRDPEQGRMVAFYDPGQSIFGRPQAVPDWPSFLLTRNFRNTRRIAEVVQRLGSGATRPHLRCPEGDPPSVHPLTTPARERAEIERLVTRLVEKEGVGVDRIVILTPHTKENSFLGGLESLGDLPLAYDPAKRDGAVLHATIGGFKGLESDVVILADVDLEDERCNRNARYVAASRARHVLHVFAKGDWLADAPE